MVATIHDLWRHIKASCFCSADVCREDKGSSITTFAVLYSPHGRLDPFVHLSGWRADHSIRSSSILLLVSWGYNVLVCQ